MNVIKNLFGGHKGFSNIIDALNQSQGVIELDAYSGLIKKVNPFFCDVLNKAEDEIVGTSLDSHCCDDQFSPLIAAQSHAHSVCDGTEEYMPITTQKGNGWLLLNFIVIKGKSDSIDAIIVFAKEASNHKSKQETDTKNKGFANALKTCSRNIMLADNQHNITYLNDAFRSMLSARNIEFEEIVDNLSPENIIGSNVNVFYKDAPFKKEFISDLSESKAVDFSIGPLTFGCIVSPWVDDAGARLGTVFEWEDKTDAILEDEKLRAIASENSRIRQALDVCDASIMLADSDLNIIYLNNAVQNMLQSRQKEIQQAIPSFNAKKLMGVCVDDFHKSANHQRNLLQNLKTTHKTDLPIGDLTFGLMATPLFDMQGLRIGTVVEWKDKTNELAARGKELALSAENARVKQALDAVSTNVMIADSDANIIYLNNSVKKMMKNAENDLKSVLNHFDADNLLGKNIDIFHKNPSHQRNLIANLQTTYEGKAEVAGRYFSVIANPILVDGQRLGTVVEWEDKTAEKNIEREVDSMLESALAGDFSQQLTLDDKEGFFAVLSKGLNTLVSTVEVSLNDILRVLGAMAKGDLSERITRDYQGSFGQLKENANTTADKLTEIIGKIRASSSAISTAANEISQGNADLSQRTEEQASSLEETASSMEQMTSTVRQSATNAQEANIFSEGVKDKAATGGAVVSKAITAMEEINVASKKISDIISVIDEIAFQTNLLALNAAVEAARAGEQGRGFAVVAGEVRNLAQRSAGAAKEIKELIRDSVLKVEDGRALVNASGDTLTEIVASVEKVSDMIREIADAAVEQTSGIEQVNTAISQMDEMTQQNAALVEEASAAGQAMADQARSMNNVVEFFNVGVSYSQTATVEPIENLNYSPQNTVMQKNLNATIQSKNTTPISSDDEWEEF